MDGTRRTESGKFSPLIASNDIVETPNLLTKAVEDPNEARQMSSVWSGCNCKLLTKPSVKNDLWKPSSRSMLASIPSNCGHVCHCSSGLHPGFLVGGFFSEKVDFF